MRPGPAQPSPSCAAGGRVGASSFPSYLRRSATPGPPCRPAPPSPPGVGPPLAARRRRERARRACGEGEVTAAERGRLRGGERGRSNRPARGSAPGGARRGGRGWGGGQRSVLGDGGVKGRRGRSEAGRRKEGRKALRCCWRRCRSRGHSRPLPPGRAGWAPQPRCLRSGPSFTARSSTRRCGRCPSATKTSPRSGPGPTAPSGEWRLRAGFCPGRRSAPLPAAPDVAAHGRWHRDIFAGEDNRVPAPSVISFRHISQCLLADGRWGWRGCGLARPRAPYSSAAIPVSFWTRGCIVSRELQRAAASPGRRCKNHFSGGSAAPFAAQRALPAGAKSEVGVQE